MNNNGKPNTRECTTNHSFTKSKVNGDAENSAVIILENKYSKNNSTTNIVEHDNDLNDEDEKDEYDQIAQKNNNLETFAEDESCKTKDENCESKC